ncbi:amino acid adenylation domain-containing protein [Streptomyces sp. NPDC014734]|uniref:amino acid adenylation domain-containing protein n=1 Tax=Streptomyces sp. NPDC014734 TaxID=3364886 RepID=UPI003700733E
MSLKISPLPCGTGLLHEAFETVAAGAADSIAVSEPGGVSLTYGELDARAQSLACRLRARGVRDGDCVGLCMGRGADVIVGLLAILKAGGAYVPLDPAYPAARLDLILADTRLRVVVTDTETAPTLARRNVDVVLVDDPGAAEPATTARAAVDRLSESSAAYVMYTSGSSGTPKGVVVEHRNVVRLFTATADRFGFGPGDVWALFHSMAFDFSVWEIWGALLHGGRLVIVPQEAVRLPERMLALLESEGVTVLNQTPSAFRGLVAAEGSRPDAAELALRLVVFGGERLDVTLLRPWIERHGDRRPELVNMYGITETTVHVTHRSIGAADLEHPEESPIGVPLTDLRVRLVDDGRTVAPGVPGEIQVSGPGVTRGYLNRAELTADRFVTAAGCRWYRSGDRAVRRADGELVYLGRVDDQIKVRGYRIEPGEVEHCLAGHGGVSAVVVAPRDYEGDMRLVAYVLPVSGGGTEELVGELSARARESLPVHLRPAVYRLLGDLPLTPQGKADRTDLDAHVLEAVPAHVAGETFEQTNRAEDVVALLVEKVLERLDIGRDDDLFDMGATSLAVVRILTEVQREFGVPVDIASLGDNASIRNLAAAVAPADGTGETETRGVPA